MAQETKLNDDTISTDGVLSSSSGTGCVWFGFHALFALLYPLSRYSTCLDYFRKDWKEVIVENRAVQAENIDVHTTRFMHYRVGLSICLSVYLHVV